jgi:hypothetical protein
MPKQEDSPKKVEQPSFADALIPLVGALLQADPEVKVRVHDEDWVDVGLSPNAAVEKIIRSLRGMTEQFKEQVSRKAGRKELLAGKEEAFVTRFPKETQNGATFCLLEGPKIWIDAVPSALKVCLRDFAQEVSSVPAASATMVRGLCADLRASPDYVANA